MVLMKLRIAHVIFFFFILLWMLLVLCCCGCPIFFVSGMTLSFIWNIWKSGGACEIFVVGIKDFVLVFFRLKFMSN